MYGFHQMAKPARFLNSRTLFQLNDRHRAADFGEGQGDGRGDVERWEPIRLMMRVQGPTRQPCSPER